MCPVTDVQPHPRRAARLLRRRRPGGRDRRARPRAAPATSPSTCARRSCTTRTSSPSSSGAARSSSTPSTTCRRAPRSSSPPTASRRPCTTNAAARGLHVIDATCPLVTKVHSEARAVRGPRLHDPPDRPRGPRGGRGHDGRGAGGHPPGGVRRRGRPSSTSQPDTPLAYVTQTTLSVDETRIVIDRLRERFPWIEAPAKDDICYATSNRQAAVKALAREVDLVLVIGSRNSSNSCRLVEVARERRRAGVPDRGRDGHRPDLARRRRRRIGITSRRLARPERLVQRVVAVVPRPRRRRRSTSSRRCTRTSPSPCPAHPPGAPTGRRTSSVR